MKQVTYTGEGFRGKDIVWDGIPFKLGVPVSVEDDVADRLSVRRHFQVTEDESVEEVKPVVKKKRGRPRKVTPE